jgi:hypothetical protein
MAAMLDTAADILERDGWVQGDYHRFEGHCAMGALFRAELTQEVSAAAAAAYLANRLKKKGQGIDCPCGAHDSDDIVINWNDLPGRTRQQVLDFLRESAKEALRGSD